MSFQKQKIQCIIPNTQPLNGGGNVMLGVFLAKDYINRKIIKNNHFINQSIDQEILDIQLYTKMP